ncbi:MAG: hypothetical protein Q9167_000769 [Letrouitia subvulpina]
MDRIRTTVDDDGQSSLLRTLERSLEDLRSLVRDMTQIFVSRLELLPAGDTIEDHKKVQADEAALVEYDKGNARSQGRGLFNGRFNPAASRLAPIRDAVDGVDRCPSCTWEIENGVCANCGYLVPYRDDDEESFVSDDRSFSSFAEEILPQPRRRQQLRGYNSEDDAVHDTHSEVSDQTFRQPRISWRERFGENNHRTFSDFDSSLTSSHDSIRDSEDLNSEDDFDEAEDEAEDDDDTGSLEDFVVNDDDMLGSSFIAHTSAGSSRDANEDAASINDDSRSYGSSEQQGLQHEDGRHPSVGSETDHQNDSGDASDVVLTMPPKRLRQRRRQMTTISSNSDTSGDAENSRASSPQQGTSGGVSPRGPIMIESDSDSPPVRRSGNRTRAPLAISSDEENPDAQGPSSIGPQSHRSHSNNQTVHEPAHSVPNFNPNSPISVNSTPEMQAFVEQGGLQERHTIPLFSPRFSQRHHVPNFSIPPNSAPENQSSNNTFLPRQPPSTPMTVDGPSTNKSQNVTDRIPGPQGPEERRVFPLSRAATQPQNPRVPQSVRQASSRRKADRKRLKEDRRRRNREQGLSTDTSNSATTPVPLTYIGS